jgi:transposase InsO family protein
MPRRGALAGSSWPSRSGRCSLRTTGKYGSPRISDDLREAGWRVSEKTVAAIMREQRLAARPKKRRKHTTRPGKGRWRAPDLVGRDFPATKVNQKWYGDGTEIATDEGKLHLASVLDMGSRRLVGFALSEHHDAELSGTGRDATLTASPLPLGSGIRTSMSKPPTSSSRSWPSSAQ